MSSSPTFIFLHYVCPSLGTILASATFGAPISSLNDALSRGSLGDLNPLPWAFMTGNCLGWVAYSFITKDPFVLAANLPGLLLSIWLNHGAAKLQYQEQRLIFCPQPQDQSGTVPNGANNIRLTTTSSVDLEGSSYTNDNDEDENGREEGDGNDGAELPLLTQLPPLTSHEHWVLRIVFIWIVIFSALMFFPSTSGDGNDSSANVRKLQQEVVGFCVNINLVVFYGAPLSTIATVVQSKSSSSIHTQTLAMTLLNTFFWLSYGIGVMDMWIFVPNGCGFVLAMITLVLRLIYPATMPTALSQFDDVQEVLVDNNHGTNDDENDGSNNNDNGRLEML